MDARFARGVRCSASSVQCGESLREVGEVGLGFAVGDELVQVGGFVELFDGFDGGLIVEVECEGVGEVDFGDAQAGVAEGIERLAAVVEFDGEVTGVVVDAKAALDEILVFALI